MTYVDIEGDGDDAMVFETHRARSRLRQRANFRRQACSTFALSLFANCLNSVAGANT
jgi:hypothetical protein